MYDKDICFLFWSWKGLSILMVYDFYEKSKAPSWSLNIPWARSGFVVGFYSRMNALFLE